LVELEGFEHRDARQGQGVGVVNPGGVEWWSWRDSNTGMRGRDKG
jgi:formylmethanofuran dehydrogenase subunit A